MDKNIKEKWITALRSGNFKQGRGALRSQAEDGSERFCCLGVLCEVLEARRGHSGGYLFQSTDGSLDIRDKMVPYRWFREKLQTKKSLEYYVAKMNDTGSSFKEIADFIEKCD